MLVSITMPVYNNLKGLDISLQSIISQTYTNWEVIVVDDGSIENHKKVVEKFDDDRIHFFRLNKNEGRSVARQKTFSSIKGQFCAFLDAGDCYEKDFLKNAIECFYKGDFLAVSQTMKIVYRNKIYRSRLNESKIINIKSFEYQDIAFAPTVIKAELCKNYVFNLPLRYSEDRFFLNYLSSNYNGKIVILNTFSYIYNQGSDNIKISTTFKKYYYDSIRLYREKKKLRALVRFFQAFLGSVYHLIFGYEAILKKRYKKIDEKNNEL